ncbi:MAG: HPr family phosphocarrier protein [Lachnospiraceae bacterium]|jgi:phosphotransferase system HPr (HPr) family protein|nr:HPr family phosphocarrier protein [Lachnospiraceae bacterium]
MLTKNITVELPANQESRPVAMLVQVASQYESVIHMENGAVRANVKSIMGMMAFGLKSGMEVALTVDGKDEADAMEAMEKQLSRAC